jgi:hypothetical protein
MGKICQGRGASSGGPDGRELAEAETRRPVLSRSGRNPGRRRGARAWIEIDPQRWVLQIARAYSAASDQVANSSTSDFVGRVLGMSVQNAAARRERGQRALHDAVGPDSGHEFVDDRVPYAARHQGVRNVICNNLDIVLSQRHEHQNAASMEIVGGHMIGESAMG